MDYNNLCFKCMREKGNGYEVCTYCGFDKSQYIPQANTLPVPSVLKGRYLIGVPLGIGGFGITYIAFDMQVGGICAIKEFMPDTVSYRMENQVFLTVSNTKTEVFGYGLSRFTQEAQLLKQFSNRRNIINVSDNFLENNTAYYVMEYLDGHDFISETANFTKQLDFDVCLSYFMQVLNGLEELHEKGIIHRDISPDNIYITKNGTIKILDFGSARYAVSQRDKHLSVILKVGYAPKEQYSAKAEQGAWTDIYALCATFYHILSGVVPEESTERLDADTIRPLNELNADVPAYFCEIIAKGMSIRKEYRFQSIAELRDVVLANTNKPQKSSMAAKHVQHEKLIPQHRAESDSSYIQTYKKHSGKRMGAFFIDVIIYSFCIGVLYIVFSSVFNSFDLLSEFIDPIIVFVILIFTILIFLINISMETSGMGGTIGKIVCGIKILDEDGGQMSTISSIKRNLYKLLGVLLLFTEKDGRFLHEIKSSSQIVEKQGGIYNEELRKFWKKIFSSYH